MVVVGITQLPPKPEHLARCCGCRPNRRRAGGLRSGRRLLLPSRFPGNARQELGARQGLLENPSPTGAQARETRRAVLPVRFGLHRRRK